MRTVSGNLHPRPGFTLVESLIVISIIGILAGLLIPTVSLVRNRFEVTKCAGQLAVFGPSIGTYQLERNGQMPVGVDPIFIKNYTTIDYTLYVVRSTKDPMRSRAPPLGRGAFSPYNKCPALIKIDAGSSRFNFTYADNAVRSRRGNNAQLLMTCGTATPLGCGWGNSSALDPAPPREVSNNIGMNSNLAAWTIQFPHYADLSQRKLILEPFQASVWHYFSGSANVLLQDGSVSQRRVLNFTGTLTDYDENRFIPADYIVDGAAKVKLDLFNKGG